MDVHGRLLRSVHRELHDSVDQLRQAVTRFVATSNTQWLIGRLGHRTPKEAHHDAIATVAA
jgi:hypothetical protein